MMRRRELLWSAFFAFLPGRLFASVLDEISGTANPGFRRYLLQRYVAWYSKNFFQFETRVKDSELGLIQDHIANIAELRIDGLGGRQSSFEVWYRVRKSQVLPALIRMSAPLLESKIRERMKSLIPLNLQSIITNFKESLPIGYSVDLADETRGATFLVQVKELVGEPFKELDLSQLAPDMNIWIELRWGWTIKRPKIFLPARKAPLVKPDFNSTITQVWPERGGDSRIESEVYALGEFHYQFLNTVGFSLIRMHHMEFALVPTRLAFRAKDDYDLTFV